MANLANALVCFVLLGTVACKTAPRLTPADTSGLDDDFAGTKLSPAWQVFRGDTFKREVKDGELIITPHDNVVWYMVDNGPMLWKTVRGNFRVSATVRARSVETPEKPPSNSNYQLAGLIARDPISDASGQENYVFNVVGFRNGYLSVETKTTRDDHSEVEGPKWDSGDAELRICRLHERFLVLKRHLGDSTWTLGDSYIRKDLAAALQVGPIAYTYTDEQDLRARFDDVKFAPVRLEKDCYADR